MYFYSSSLLIFALCFCGGRSLVSQGILLNASYYLNGSHVLNHHLNNTHRVSTQWTPLSSQGFHLQLFRDGGEDRTAAAGPETQLEKSKFPTSIFIDNPLLYLPVTYRFSFGSNL